MDTRDVSNFIYQEVVLIMNYMVFVDYLITSWLCHLVFMLPIMFTCQLVFLYRTIKIDFNYQLNNVMIVVLYFYLAMRHYKNQRLDLETFVTSRENENLRLQQIEILNNVQEAAVIVTDPYSSQLSQRSKSDGDTERFIIRNTQPKLLFCNAATASLAAEPLDQMTAQQLQVQPLLSKNIFEDHNIKTNDLAQLYYKQQSYSERNRTSKVSLMSIISKFRGKN